MIAQQYSEDQRDCLQEICNVAMGQAGDALARDLGVFVTLSIPIIRIIEASQLSVSLKNFGSSTGIYAASQLFSSDALGSDLAGLALVMLSEESLLDLQELMADSATVASAQEDSSDKTDTLVTGTCRNLAQTSLDALSEQWGLGFHCDAPKIVGHESLGDICESLTAGWSKMLVVEINYQLEDRPFNGDLVLLFPDGAISAMAKRLDELLAD